MKIYEAYSIDSRRLTQEFAKNGFGVRFNVISECGKCRGMPTPLKTTMKNWTRTLLQVPEAAKETRSPS